MVIFTYIWKYHVKTNFKLEFINAYGPNEDWVKLFRKAEGYIKTELMSDKKNPDWFITVDHWESFETNMAFREKFSNEFQELDEKCDLYTYKEVHIGDFDIIN